MADMAIVNSKVATLNVKQALTLTAADVDVADAVQKFVYTPTDRKPSKICFLVQVGPTNGAVAHSISAGTGVFGLAARTGSTAQSTTGLIQIETGSHQIANGTIEITFTPASGKKLLTDHALKVSAIELL